MFVFVLPGVLNIDRRPSLSAGTEQSRASTITSKLDRPVPKNLDLVAAAGDTGPGAATAPSTTPRGACSRRAAVPTCC